MANTIEQQIQAIHGDLMLFPDWMQRYEYIIDCGKQLADMPNELMTTANEVHGCQSRVWLHAKFDGQFMQYQATSDAIIVKGLIALLLRIFNNQPAAAIVATDLGFIETLELSQHLSMNRSNGLYAMINKIKAYANEYTQSV